MPEGEDVAVACSLSDIFHLQGWQLTAQACCAGSLQCVFSSLWTSSGLRSLQTAFAWSVISTEAVHPSLSAPPWFVPWHSACPVKLGCLFNETNYKYNYPGFICQRIDTKAERKKITSEVKFSLTMGYIPWCITGLGCRLSPVSPVFGRRPLCFRISSFSSQGSHTCLKSLRFIAVCAWCIASVCCTYDWLCQCPAAYSQVFVIKKEPQEQIFSLHLSLKAGCTLTCSSVGAQWELHYFRHNLVIWWYSNPFFSVLWTEWIWTMTGISSFVCLCISVCIRKHKYLHT